MEPLIEFYVQLFVIEARKTDIIYFVICIVLKNIICTPIFLTKG